MALELWNRSQHVRGALTASGSRYSVLRGLEVALETNMRVELCFVPDALPRNLVVDADTIASYRVSENLETFVAEDVPFSFAIHDDVTTLVAYNDAGIPSVLVENESVDLRRWLEGQFETCRAHATPVDEFLEPSDRSGNGRET